MCVCQQIQSGGGGVSFQKGTGQGMERKKGINRMYNGMELHNNEIRYMIMRVCGEVIGKTRVIRQRLRSIARSGHADTTDQ